MFPKACRNDYPMLTSSKLPKELADPSEDLAIKRIWNSYTSAFKDQIFEDVKAYCVEYLLKLKDAKAKRPHRYYELGALAITLCHVKFAGNF